MSEASPQPVECDLGKQRRATMTPMWFGTYYLPPPLAGMDALLAHATLLAPR